MAHETKYWGGNSLYRIFSWPFIFASKFCFLALAILRVIFIKYHWVGYRASLFNTNQ